MFRPVSSHSIRCVMKIILRFSASQEAKALPILLRHSPGMVLPGRTYVLSEDSVRALLQAGVRFTELSREADVPDPAEAATRERV